MGYNGFPRGVHDELGRYENRERKYQLVVHAEVNAILNAGEKAKGATLYVWPAFMLPNICHECCKCAIQAGVKRIVGFKPEENEERAKRWKESIGISRTLCVEAGVDYYGVQE